MTEDEFKEVEIGDFLLHGNHETIKVHRKYRCSVEFWRDGYWHEANRENLSKLR